jgi:hypothetical protein
MSLGEAAGTAVAMSLNDNVSPRKVDVSKLQRQLVKNGYNIGQRFRKIPALENTETSAETSAYAIDIKSVNDNG